MKTEIIHKKPTSKADARKTISEVMAQKAAANPVDISLLGIHMINPYDLFCYIASEEGFSSEKVADIIVSPEQFLRMCDMINFDTKEGRLGWCGGFIANIHLQQGRPVVWFLKPEKKQPWWKFW